MQRTFRSSKTGTNLSRNCGDLVNTNVARVVNQWVSFPQKQRSRSPADFRRYVMMAIGSSDEMRVWLRYCLDLGFIDEAAWRNWRDEYQEISKMLQGLSKSLKQRI